MALSSKTYRYYFLFIIGAVLVLSYHNSLSGPFVFDDYGNIVGNKNIYLSSLDFNEIKNVFSPYQNSANRKLANLTFAINYYFGQLNPVGFHFVNILIHILNAWCIFYLFQWYYQKVRPKSDYSPIILSGLASLLWATNPIQTTAVGYIVQRMTSLSTLFCMVALLFYLQAKRQTDNHAKTFLSFKQLSFYMASVISWLCAMLSKEIAAVFPLLILIHEIYFFELYRKFKARQKKYLLILLIFLIAGIAEILYFMGPSFLQGILNGYDHRNFTLAERLLSEPRVVFHYISLFLYPLPSRLQLFYDNYPISHSLWSPANTMLAISGIVAWIVAIIYFFKRNKLISFGLTWTFICLLLESTVIALELVFEHRFYMPSIGFALVLTSAGAAIFNHTRLRPIFFYIFLSFLICTQILGTYSRNKDWNDEISFSMDEAVKNPDSVRVLTNLGWALINAGDPVLAAKPLHKAHALDPDNILVLNNLYTIYSNPPYHNRRIAEAYLQQILKIVKSGHSQPSGTDALYSLAHHLFKREQYNESLLFLKQIASYYRSPDVYVNIGQCYLQLNQPKEAIKYFSKALQLAPEDAKTLFFYALSHQKANMLPAAVQILSTIPIDSVKNTKLKQDIIDLQASFQAAIPQNE